ncbi:molecular chaperone [Seleniivibrio woodruffii]|uniref:TorD/DmsD family molecular chaperone n=1 Tax=Seleniivibrio woodruffii TaxID=1078050 RepID=UPI0026E948E9|nr:molecular chaperone TorD family protein [Seleniivibrio woodruffii]
MDVVELANIHKGRNVAFNVFSKVFMDVPSQETDSFFKATARHIETIAMSSCNSDMHNGAGLLKTVFGTKDYESAETEQTRMERSRDFTRLFALNTVPLYESVYTSPEKLMKQDSWSAVKVFYLSNFFKRIDGDKTIEDHVSLELQFMGLLSKNIADCLENEKFEAAETIMTTQLDFYNNHILRWVPELCGKVIAEAEVLNTLFYPAYAYMLRGFLAEDSAFLTELAE